MKPRLNLSKLIEAVLAGEDVIIAQAGKLGQDLRKTYVNSSLRAIAT